MISRTLFLAAGFALAASGLPGTAMAQTTDIGRACVQVGANEWSVDEVTVRSITENTLGNTPSVALTYQTTADALGRAHSVECAFGNPDEPTLPTRLCMDGYCFSETEDASLFDRLIRRLKQSGF